MGKKIVEIKLVLGNTLADTAGFLFVVLLLCTLHEADHITHTQDTVCHTRGVEHIERVHLLTRTDKLDRLVDHRADRERGTTAGIAIKFGQYHTVEINTVVEGLGGIDRVLTCHSIHYEQRFGRLDSLFDSRNLLHHLLIDGKTAGSINDDHIVAELACPGNSVLRFLDGVGLGFLGIDLRIDLVAEDTQLLDSRRTIDIAGSHHHALAFLGLEIVRQFGSKSGLTRTLETRHKNHGRRTFEVDVGSLAAHQFREFVVGNLDHQLPRAHGGNHVLPKGFFLHLVGKLLRRLVVDIGFEQRLADVLDGLRDIDFGNTSFALQNLERAFQSFTKIIKHIAIVTFKGAKLQKKTQIHNQ